MVPLRLPRFFLALVIAFAVASATRAGSPGSWTIVTDHAAFSPRDSASAAVFLGRMWLTSGYPNDVADLWSSPDGISWTRVLETTPYPVYSSLIVYGGKLWAIGGSVWSSDDGVNWTEVLDFDHRPFPWASTAVVHDNRMWALGEGPGVWSSTDGVNWTCATASAPYGNRSFPAVASFNGKLWLMGGSTPAPGKGISNPNGLGYPDIDMNNDVWCSTDGAAWTRTADHAAWNRRMWSSAQAYAGRLWIMGGYDNDAYTNLGDTWYTTDGIAWRQQSQSEVSWVPRHFPTTLVFNDSLWLIAGNAWPVQNDVWKLSATPPTATVTNLTASIDPIAFGDPVTFTAVVTPQPPDGMLTFKEGATTLASVPLSAGTAVFTTAAIAVGTHVITASYEGDPDYAASADWTEVAILSIALLSPANVAATATSISQVVVGWGGVPNASSYQIFRKSAGQPYSFVGSAPAPAFLDPGVLSNTSYLYVVRAIGPDGISAFSGPDLATTVTLSDDPIIAGSTVVRAAHLNELRAAVDAVLACAEMPALPYTETLMPGAVINATDVTELRAQLTAARAALGLPAIVYSDPVLAAGDTIRAAHVQELRSAVR
jgi:Big-like domain-containing protein